MAVISDTNSSRGVFVVGGDATSITLSLVAIPAIVVFIWQRYQDTQAKHLSVASVSCFAVGSLWFFFLCPFCFCFFLFTMVPRRRRRRKRRSRCCNHVSHNNESQQCYISSLAFIVAVTMLLHIRAPVTRTLCDATLMVCQFLLFPCLSPPSPHHPDSGTSSGRGTKRGKYKPQSQHVR